mgnify:CR=1 FL=1
MPPQHIVKAFDEQLNSLDAKIAEMGGLAEAIVSKTGAVIATKNVELTADIARHDEQVDRLVADNFETAWKELLEASRFLRGVA